LGPGRRRGSVRLVWLSLVLRHLGVGLGRLRERDIFWPGLDPALTLLARSKMLPLHFGDDRFGAFIIVRLEPEQFGARALVVGTVLA
jgi:hypothetical protein